MAEVVRLSRKGSLALLEIDSPPVNAMSQDMRQGLRDAFTSLQSERDVKAVLIHCAGRTFVSGADLREFDTGVGEPNYHLVFGLIENFDRPVIAALHGARRKTGITGNYAGNYSRRRRYTTITAFNRRQGSSRFDSKRRAHCGW
jgi:3-hydroxyacyl-CoA dehydrogenase